MMGGIGRSITFKWMVFSILLATIPLVIAGVNIVQVYQKGLKASVIEIEKEKANVVVERVKGFLERTTSNLISVTEDRDITKSSLVHTKRHLKNLLSQHDNFFELALLDEKGLEMVKVSKFKAEKTSTRKNQSENPMFKKASKGQIFYGDFYYTSDGNLTITIAVPTEEYRGSPVGVLRARLDLRHLQKGIAEMKIGEKGFAYVVDKEGFLIVHPREVNIQFGPFVDRAIAGEEGSVEFENVRGQKYLVVYKPIPELQWGVVIQVPTGEVYAPLKEVASMAIKWVLISLCVAFFISLFFARRWVRPIKQLSSKMARVSSGDLDVHIETTRKDEVGILTNSFNRMIQDLKQSQETIQEAEQKYRMIFENSKDMVFITSVGGKFIEINRAGAEMLGYGNREELREVSVRDIYIHPEDRIKFQEEVAKNGFAKDFEVKLKRKDGAPLDCLITATARRDEDGHIIGYEGTIKNISYRKKMEEELIRRTEEAKTLNDLSNLVNQSLELDKVMPIALEKVLTLVGFEMGTIYLVSEDREWIELKYHKNYPDHLTEAVKRLKWGEGVAGSAVEKKEIVFFSIDQYPSQRILPSLMEEGIRILVGIPLLSKGEAMGAICLTNRSSRHITQEEIHLLESLGNQIGMAIENAKLFSVVAKAKSEWETTFDTVTDLITIRDKDFKILRANRTTFLRYGLKPEEMIGKRCHEILHHRDTPCEGCYVTEALRTRKPTSGERESDYLNGTFQYYTYPIHDESGNIIAVVDLAREVTEEKRLEKEKEVVNQVNKILASSLDVREVMKAVHTEMKKILSSDRMTVTLIDKERKNFKYFALEKDYTEEELSYRILYPIEGTSFGTVVETGLPMVILDTAESNTFLDQKLSKEGIRSYLVYPLEYKGKIIGTLNFGSKELGHFSEGHFEVLRQIVLGMAISTQNALLLDEIKGSEEKYRTLVEGMLDGIAVVGRDFKFKYTNNRLAEIMGYTKEELEGMDFRNLLTEESRQYVVDRYIKWLKKEEDSPNFEFNAVRKNGEIRNIEMSNKETRDSEGKLDFISIMRDITEKKKMEEQLLQSEKLRALGEMASGVAHDFNNALAAILGNTQLLLYTVQEEDMRDSLKTIEKVAKDSAQTVKRLQEFTRKRARQELFKLDINSIIRDVVEITKPKWKDEAQGKGIPIEMMLHLGDLPDAAGNASEMREVITNIIFNAIEAIPGGGKIEIRTFKKGDSVHIRIADTGVGMDEETRKKIFEPFFTTKPFSNTGLGLSMSYGIIKRFGGEIEVESSVGGGTTFTIVLPITMGGKEEVEAYTRVNIGKSLRILVIDDEETVRTVLGKLLSQANHQVTVANDGEKGLQLFQEKEFDIVLTDLGMPGISGWEVCKRIKEIKHTTPVGMITGWGMEVSEDKMKEHRLDFILSKPFDFNQVVKVVSDTIGVRA